MIRKHLTDHPPAHVHVYKDGEPVAKYDLDNRVFIWVKGGHAGRILRALKNVGLIA